jgi:hypothetical protein
MGGTPEPGGHDRQWELNRRNFEGRWCGTSQWFLRDGQGVLDLRQPSRVIPDTCYAISFSDADTGVWDGAGLLFAPDGRRRLPLCRAAYNSGGQCWQFAGAGGQSSLDVNPAESRFGHEINLFHHGGGWRSRSMLVLLWGRREPGGDGAGHGLPGWQLDAVGAVPFRCHLAAAVEPPRPQGPWQELLAEQRGWPGVRERLQPGVWPSHDPPPEHCAPFDPALFSGREQPGGGEPLVAGCGDGLVFAVPESLPAGAFSLQVGCRLAAERFDLISIHFGADQRLQAWERRRFSPARAGCLPGRPR